MFITGYDSTCHLYCFQRNTLPSRNGIMSTLFFLQNVRELVTSGDNIRHSLCLRRLRSIVRETGMLRRFHRQPDILICCLGFH